MNLRVGEINEPAGVKLWLRKLGGDEFKNTKFNVASAPIEISCKCGYAGKISSLPNTHSPEPELEIIDVKLQELKPHAK